MMVWWLAVGACLLSAGLAATPDLSELTWKGAVTEFNGKRIYNGAITRAQIYKDDVFLCIPRLRSGLEYTLLRGKAKSSDSRLEPYPPWAPQTEGDCNCLQSAVDIFLDPAATLWVLDTGKTHVIDTHPITRCPPKVVAYDVTNAKLMDEVSLSGLVVPESRLQFILADYSEDGTCYLYISDAGTASIIVYNTATLKGSRVSLPQAAIPDSRDVLYITLVRKPSGDKFIYFTYRSSDDLFSISTKDLQSEQSCEKAVDVGKKPGKLIFLGTDDWESEYLRYENTTEVYKWETAKPFLESNFQVVDKGKAGLIPTHAITDYKRGVMRLLESNLVQFVQAGAEPQTAVNTLKVMHLDD